MLNKMIFEKLSPEQKERVLSALFNAKYPGFEAKHGIVVDTLHGYSIRIASLLSCEEQNETVKRIAVFLYESKTPIEAIDIDTFKEYLEQLSLKGIFAEGRDEAYLITNQKWSYEAYGLSREFIKLMDFSTLIEEIKKYSMKKNKKAQELKNVLKYCSLLPEES